MDKFEVACICLFVGIVLCAGSFYLGVELSETIKNWEKNHVSTKIDS